MKMNLKNFFLLIVILELVFMVLVVCFVEINIRLKEKLTLATDQRFSLNQAADRLRQSSDDLTRFARTYVVTGNREYRDNYYAVLAIRNGKAPRPSHYNSIYWDYLEPLRSRLHPSGEPISLESIMAGLPYTDEERSKLRESHRNSDGLVGLEMEAFHAMDGEFRDEHGGFTVKGEPDQDYAISILHSDTYHLCKQSIMKPIDEFIVMLNRRTLGKVDYLKQKSRRMSLLFELLIVLFLSTNMAVFLKLHKRVLSNVTYMTETIHASSGSHFRLNPPNMQPDDELGMLVAEFNTMQEVIDDRTNLLNRAKEELQDQQSVVNKYVIISETDLDGNITYTSDAFCKASGYTRDELIGQNHRVIQDPGTPKEVFREMWTCLTNGAAWHGQIRNRRKDGTLYWVEAAIEPMSNSDGERIGYRSIRIDITDKKRAEHLSVTDKLTGLVNRLKLDEVFHYELNRSERYKKPFSIALLDIDHFKNVNDAHGHQIGDQTLQEIALVLSKNVRASDTVGRWGGEEFLVICPETDLDGATKLAEKLCKLVEGHDFPTVGSATVSIGVTTFADDDRQETMTQRADEALYRAKSNGRNQVVALAASDTESAQTDTTDGAAG